MPSVVFVQRDRTNGELFMTDVHSSNRLLAAMPFKEYERLAPNLKPFSLKYGDAIYAEGSLIKYVYFPLGGIVSLLSAVDELSLIHI